MKYFFQVTELRSCVILILRTVSRSYLAAIVASSYFLEVSKIELTGDARTMALYLFACTMALYVSGETYICSRVKNLNGQVQKTHPSISLWTTGH